MPTDPTKIECVYFKDSGKFYARDVERFPAALFAPFDTPIYPRDYGMILLALGRLPGLIGGKWNYCFTVCVNDEYPELITPAYVAQWGLPVPKNKE